jgi:hypothetical protein
MQYPFLRTSVLIFGVLLAALNLYSQTEAGKDPRAIETQGIPARATPGDYQAHTKAGTVTVAAEYIGHYIPTDEGTLTTEDFVVVETALYGAPGSKLTLSPDNFSLRINGKKNTLASQPYVTVFSSLKDPNWEPPTPPSGSKSKTSINGGGEQGDNSPPPPVHVPIEVQRSMAQRTQKAALAEGERPLPQGGLLFFQHRGKGIHSVELIYDGPGGKATLALQP